uniref:Uncharacterized protein n=1 Tax=Cacopsylla melanoneura TaxID=428564 RepID=A0A8D8VXS5_9HEMI
MGKVNFTTRELRSNPHKTLVYLPNIKQPKQKPKSSTGSKNLTSQSEMKNNQPKKKEPKTNFVNSKHANLNKTDQTKTKVKPKTTNEIRTPNKLNQSIKKPIPISKDKPKTAEHTKNKDMNQSNFQHDEISQHKPKTTKVNTNLKINHPISNKTVVTKKLDKLKHNNHLKNDIANKSDTSNKSEYQSHDAPHDSFQTMNLPSTFDDTRDVNTLHNMSTTEQVSHSSINKNIQIEEINDNAYSIDDTSKQMYIDQKTYINMRDGFMNKICEQHKEIEELRLQIMTLECLLESRSTEEQLNTVAAQQRSQHAEPEHGIHAEAQTSRDKVSSCLIIGDSHVRGLSEKLSALLPKSCKVESFFQPGAGLHAVAQTLFHNPDLIQHNSLDTVVIMCGTNDVCSTTWDTVKQGLDNLISTFHGCKQFCIISVPLRYNTKSLNYHIHRFNSKIRNYVKSKCPESFYYIDTSKFLKFRDYAVDRLHLNKSGKDKLCNKIRNSITKKFSILPASTVRLSQSEHPLIDLTENDPVAYAQVETHSRDIPSAAPNLSSATSTPYYIPNSNLYDPNSTESYYRLTQKINMSTLVFSDNSSYFESPIMPIPIIEPTHHRNQRANFKNTGPILKI